MEYNNLYLGLLGGPVVLICVSEINLYLLTYFKLSVSPCFISQRILIQLRDLANIIVLKKQRLLFLNCQTCASYVIKRSVILFMNTDIVFSHSMKLYSAHRQEGIMSELDSVGLQDSARENLASKIGHSDEKSVLPAFKNYLQMKS